MASDSPQDHLISTSPWPGPTDVKIIQQLTIKRGLYRLEQYSIPVGEDPNERRLNRYDGPLMKYLYEDGRTLLQCLQRGSKVSSNGPCLGRINKASKAVEWISYEETLTRVQYFGDGLLALGQKPGNIIGIFAGNRPEYPIVEYGCYWHSLAIAPIYHTLGLDICNYIANQTEAEVIVVDTKARLDEVLGQVEVLKYLKVVIVMDEMEEVVSGDVQVLTMKDVETLGRANPQMPNNATPSDVAVICYTSGTTGSPKGAILSHENIVSCASGIVYQAFGHEYNDCDVLISYLPLAHVMERVAELCCLMVGARVVYFSGDITQLPEDMQIAKPTIFLTVPRLIARIVDKLFDNVRGSWFKRFLLSRALASKMSAYKAGHLAQNTLWDKLIFDRLRANLGGHVRLVISGSALLDAEYAQILRSALGCVLLNGFGQTECGIATYQIPFDPDTDNAGAPLASCHVKLGDLPEMNLIAAQGTGEILIQGPLVCRGYYKDEAATAAMFTEDGWLRTGDIGRWSSSGTLQVVDRIKNQFKLSQGEFIAVEKLQSAYEQSAFVSQIFVYGDSSRAFLVAIIVPEVEYLKSWAGQNGVQLQVEKMNEVQKLQDTILADLQQIAIKMRFNKLEYIKRIHLHPEPFTLEQGLLTPTLKMKRYEMKAYFQEILQNLYQ